MNKFQAMAQIMMFLNKDGLLKPGSQVYKIVREKVSEKIDRLGPDAAYSQVKWSKYQLLVEIEELQKAEKAGKILSNFI